MSTLIKKTLQLAAILCFFSSCSPVENYSLKQSLFETLTELDSSLLTLQNIERLSQDFGGLWCNHCQLYHTRAAEAVFPFAYIYSVLNDEKYLIASINLGNWLIRQQCPDGSWKETPEEWTGTTTDQLLMMAQAFPVVKNHLNETDLQSWLNSMKMAGDYLVQVMTPEFASINYVATTTATLMVLNGIIPEQKYTSRAGQMARQVIARMDNDMFITGEGGRILNEKYGVDLAYNMEMSLWGLGLYARLSGDKFVLDKVIESTKRHLYFIYPDGSLDGSWGIRSNKWTCFGGATSDGIQVLFSLMENADPRFYTAAARNLNYLKSCMKGGFVGYGPQHWEVMKEEPCIYPTFAKAKNLAMAHAFLATEPGSYPELPSDKNGLNVFPTLNIATVRTDNFYATVTAYNYKDPKGSESKYMFRPAGGAISNLWVKDLGFLTASSQTEYHRWEPMHFPVAENLKCLTPRIEFENNTGYFTNLYEFDALTSINQDVNEISVKVFGDLKDRNQQAGGIGYSYEYIFSANSLTKKIHLRYHALHDTVMIVEPIIQFQNTRIEQTAKNSVTIKAGNKSILFELKTEEALLASGNEANNYWWPYPALKAYPVILTVIPDSTKIENEIEFSYTIK